MNADQQKENKLTLDLLDAIEQNDSVSQRHLAKEMGVALGLANTYLKRCVKKGWVKITNAPANRYLYYLTPTGFSEKARITGEFLTTSLTLVRQSGDAYIEVFDRCVADERRHIILVGLSDLSEMAYVRSMDQSIEIIGVYNPNLATDNLNYRNSQADETWLGLPVFQRVEPGWENVAFVMTALACESELLNRIHSVISDATIYFPSFLRSEITEQAKNMTI